MDAVIYNLTEYRNTNNDTKADQLISDIEALSKLANETDAQAVIEYLYMYGYFDLSFLLYIAREAIR